MTSESWASVEPIGFPSPSPAFASLYVFKPPATLLPSSRSAFIMFPFLDLPYELQAQIVEYLLVAHEIRAPLLIKRSERPLRERQSRLSLGLLETCRSIHAIASHILYTRNNITIQLDADSPALIRNDDLPGQSCHIEGQLHHSICHGIFYSGTFARFSHISLDFSPDAFDMWKSSWGTDWQKKLYKDRPVWQDLLQLLRHCSDSIEHITFVCKLQVSWKPLLKSLREWDASFTRVPNGRKIIEAMVESYMVPLLQCTKWLEFVFDDPQHLYPVITNTLVRIAVQKDFLVQQDGLPPSTLRFQRSQERSGA